MWIAAAVLGYVLLAIVFILDKHILSQEVRKPIAYTFYSTIFLLAIGLMWLFIPFETSLVYWLWAIISGFTFGLAMHLMFVAVAKSEASHMDPFIGAVITITIFVGAYFWLGEKFTDNQLGGIICLGLASLFLAVENKGRSKQARWPWYLLGIASAVFFAVSHLTAKALYDQFGFISGLVGARFTTGIFGILLLLLPSTVKALQARPTKTSTQKNPMGLVILDKALGVGSVMLTQYAISLSSVTVVNALSGLQYALMFVIIAIMSRQKSKFLKEKFTWLETTAQVIGLILIIIGLYLVV